MHTAASCHAVAKQTSIETSVIHVSTRIDLHSSTLVNWHLKLERAHSCQLPCSCKTNFNWNICHPCIYSHWFAFIQFICQLTSETPRCTQLPAAVAKQTSMETSVIYSLICIHPWVNWHLKLERVRSCCQMPVAKQTSMETKLSSSYLLALICIHPIYLPTNIWHECAWGSEKKDLDTVHSCQLPLAKPGGHWFPTSALVEKDTSSDLCMTAEGNLIDQRCKTLNGKRVCKFDFFYSHLFIWFHKKWLIRVSDRCGINKCISIKEKNVQWFHCQHLHVERTL